eukprot:5916243-Pyramimonas_sp.AAC.1
MLGPYSDIPVATISPKSFGTSHQARTPIPWFSSSCEGCRRRARACALARRRVGQSELFGSR